MRMLVPCLVLILGACQASPPAPLPASPTLAARGQARAEAQCSGCHAVDREGTSSNRNAPPFHAIINQVDLRPETAAAWLRDAHNYPAEMNFSLSENQVEELVTYMVSLRDPNYRRIPD
ncbi:MAG: c-type cytochrome [Sphingomonas sp.]